MASALSPSAAPSPTVSISQLGKEIRQEYNVMAASFALLCYGYFSFLVVLDVWRAFKKRASWLPGKAFALTGVTVQIIVWWTSLGKLFRNLDVEIDDDTLYIGFSQIVVSGRVAVCVFVGYLLPEMSATSVRAFLTLGTAIGLQIVSELVFLSGTKSDKRLYNDRVKGLRNWVALVDKIILMCVIGLGLILGCTVLAIKNIRGLLRQRISEVFSIRKEDGFQSSVTSWDDFENEVLRSWLVARVCRPDYIIARSVLSSAVGVLVTISVILCIWSNTYHNIVFRDSSDPFIYVFVPLFSFIIIGWVFISWRWLIAQLWFHRKGRDGGHNWKRYFSMEDFWTNNTVALIHMYDIKRDRASSMSSTFKKLKSSPTIVQSRIAQAVIFNLLILQRVVVYFSKICGLVSHVLLGKHLYWCRKHLMKRDHVELLHKIANDLKCVCLPGEDPYDLWEANKMAFLKVKHLIQKGRERGESSEEIKSFFGRCSPQWAKDGALLLSTLNTIRLPSAAEHFPAVQIQCVQMTVVSLMTIFIELHSAKSDHLDKALEACRAIWDLLSFVDDCHIDLHANQISLLDDFNKGKVEVCIAAEKEFYKLRSKYEKLPSSYATNGKDNCSILKDLSKQWDELLERGSQNEVSANLRDSKVWPEMVRIYTIYTLCNEMLSKGTQGFDFVAWTEASLRNVIVCSISRLPDILVKQCWKWAQDFEEDKLWEVSPLVGKCSGVMKAWELKPKAIMNTTKEWTIQVPDSTEWAADHV